MRCRQIHGISRFALGQNLVLLRHAGGLFAELGLIDQHARLKIIDATGIGDQYFRVPDKRYVADRAPQQQWQNKRANHQETNTARR
jgi:hypothetical protein